MSGAGTKICYSGITNKSKFRVRPLGTRLVQSDISDVLKR